MNALHLYRALHPRKEPVYVPGWTLLVMLAVLTGGLSVGFWLGSVAVGAVW